MPAQTTAAATESEPTESDAAKVVAALKAKRAARQSSTTVEALVAA
jgi:hypothetical protein